MQEIAEKIRTRNDFLIISHINPDGDAIGSGMALKLILEKLGKKATFSIDGKIPDKLDFVLDFCDFTPPEVVKDLSFQCVISVDAADKSRIGNLDKVFDRAEQRIVIDHHPTNPGFGDINYIDPVAATGVLIDRLRNILGVELDRDMASLLYVAVCTDTGNFTYQNTDEEVFNLAARIRKAGADIPFISERIYKMRKLGATRLIGRSIERILMNEEKTIALSYVLLSDFEEFGALSEDTEEIIDFLRAIIGVEIAIVMKEVSENVFRLSFRSKEYADVAELASQFKGGGHKHASGGEIRGPLEECIRLLFEKVEEKL